MKNTHRIIRALGILLSALGLWIGFNILSFIHSSQKVEGRVVGYSSVQRLDRTEGDCSAFSKGCAVKVEYKLEDGSTHSALLSQPIFGRSKVTSIGLLVNPASPDEPRIASLNVLFRNPLFLTVFGLTIFGLSFAIAASPSNKNLSANPS